MIGISAPSSRLKEFETAISEGSLLMMVDVPKDRVSAIKDMVHNLYPQADLGTTEPQIPAFP